MSQTTKGIWLMVLAVLTFAVQDGFSRLLAGEYNTLMVVMVRYWIFGAFVLGVALRRPEGLRSALRSRHFATHVLRAALLVAEICCIVWAYTMIGLINAHAVFAVCPLIVVASTNVKAVENVLHSFATISAQTGHERWHPYPGGFGQWLTVAGEQLRPFLVGDLPIEPPLGELRALGGGHGRSSASMRRSSSARSAARARLRRLFTVPSGTSRRSAMAR